MPDNYAIKDAAGQSKTKAADEVSGVLRDRVQVCDPTSDVLTGSATNLAAQVATNSLLTVHPGQWTVTHIPAANTVATATKTAGATGVRHVCTGIVAVLTGGTSAPTAINPVLHLRDGATGAGTPLLSMTLGQAAVAGQATVISLQNLNIVGSAATAMCLEFAAAAGANTFESVTLIGHSCSG